MKITQISRDPFAREDIVRTTMQPLDRCSCSWCGRVNAKYRYGVQRDSILHRAAEWFSGIFCSIDCCRSYHGHH